MPPLPNEDAAAERSFKDKLKESEQNAKKLYNLIGGRSGRMKLIKDAKTKETIQVINTGAEGELPMINLIYSFFKEPKSSLPAECWGAALCCFVVVDVLRMALTTADGPNQYVGRENRAHFPFLPSAQSYQVVYVVTQVPLLIDAGARFVMLCVLALGEGNAALFSELLADSFNTTLFMLDILSAVPFIVNVAYVQKYHIDLTSGSDEGYRVLMRLFELFACSRVLRYLKDIPSVWSIRTSLGRAAPHLVLPFFFFFVFNILAASLFYFIEPCYNNTTCPWQSLFNALFYSVVTMTTVGYGNQVPVFELGRFIAVCVMIFGALFISMPLALIGNEYNEAWEEVQARQARERAIQEALRIERLRALESFHMTLDDFGDLAESRRDEENSVVRLEQELLAASPLMMEFRILELIMEQQAKYAIETRKLLGLEDEELEEKKRKARIKARKDAKEARIKAEEAAREAARVNDRSGIPASLLMRDGALDGALGAIGGGSGKNHQLGGGSGKKSKRKDESGSDSDNSNSDSDSDESEESEGQVERKKASWASTALPRMLNNVRQTMLNLTNTNSRATIRERASQDSAFKDKIKAAVKNPLLLKSRIFMFLELPHSSRQAQALQYVLIFLIGSSIMLFFMETVITLSDYGENTAVCGQVLQLYCVDKSPDTDPGCYVHDPLTGVVTSNLLSFPTTTTPCTDYTCFAQGSNFGTYNTTVVGGTCVPIDPALDLPFQDSDSLAYQYRTPYLFTSRNAMHRINNICHRIECSGLPAIIKGKPYFLIGEYAINGIFTFELVLRILVANSPIAYFRDKMNWIDLLAVLPFYYSVLNQFKKGATVLGIDFSILPSSPQPIFDVLVRATKVLRLFKLTRQFRAAKVLSETANQSFFQILSMVGLLFLIVIILAILLYEVEHGKPCYVDDPGPLGCTTVPSSIAARVHPGYRISIDKNGNLSNFSNVFYCVWFAFVTVTTTGYGDIIPVTNGGQIMAVFLMLVGVCYMSMPLTAAASTFYEVHQKYVEKRQRIDNLEKVNIRNLESFKASHLTLGAKRRLIKLHEELQGVHEQLVNFANSWKTGTNYTKQVSIGAGKKLAGGRQTQTFLLEKMQMLADSSSQVLAGYKNEVYRLALFDAKKHQYWLEIAKTGAQTKDEGHHQHHNMFAG